MKFNHLAPATVSLIVSLVALSSCSEKSATTNTTTGETITLSPHAAHPEATAAPATGAAATSAPGAPASSAPGAPGKTEDPSNVSNLKPYTPPPMAPGFPGKGEAKEWTKATKFYNDGIDASGSRKFPEAIKLYNKAIEVYPYDANFYANLGFALERNGDPAAGAVACKKGLELEKGFGGAWENLGNCEYDLGHISASKEAFEKAIQCELTPAKRNELIGVIQKLSTMKDAKPETK